MIDTIELWSLERMKAREMAREMALFTAPRAVWTLEDAAVYMRCSIRLMRKYATQTDFPKAIRLYGTGHPRYKASEICAWAESHKEKA